jgi:hypothetical protein
VVTEFHVNEKNQNHENPHRTSFYTEPNFYPMKKVNENNLEKYLNKSDLMLYNKILNLIIKDWDGMDTQQLSELLDKLRELHDNLDKVILQRKQSSLFDTGGVNKNNEKGSVSLSELLHSIRRQKKRRN